MANAGTPIWSTIKKRRISKRRPIDTGVRRQNFLSDRMLPPCWTVKKARLMLATSQACHAQLGIAACISPS